MKELVGNIVDIHSRQIFYGRIVYDQTIKSIERLENSARKDAPYIAPGLVDAHVHIESSMLIPERFAQMVAERGTVAVVCDPHEITNVLGSRGMHFMMENAQKACIKIYFAVPSCVPATPFETNGALFGVDEVAEFLPKCVALAEMMNYPGVIFEDEVVMAKLKIAKQLGKPIDGHSPCLSGAELEKYVRSGISTDHECSTLAEAEEKIGLGMMIQVREGSAAKNFQSLHQLFSTHPNSIMLCTDDAHADDIIKNGHIDRFIHLGRQKNISIFDVYQASLLNTKKHYNLNVGTLQVGDTADIIIVNDVEHFQVQKTIINGDVVYDRFGDCYPTFDAIEPINNFIDHQPFSADDFKIKIKSASANAIEVIDGEIITKKAVINITQPIGSDFECEDDLAKIAVINRYAESPVALAIIKGTGLKRGAIACSIAHDSHNVVLIGKDNESLKLAADEIFSMKGGLVVTDGSKISKLALPFAGLMCNENYTDVARQYESLIEIAQKQCGLSLSSPFMTMSFMSLLVIPELKLSDKGLFDVGTFSFTDLFN